MPDYGPSAVEILTNDFSYKKAWLTDKILPISLGGVGMILAFYLNYGQRRPVFSGIQKHVGLTLTGAVLGYYCEQWRSDYLAEKDAVLRHYVELHPDDFPTKERKKYKDVMERWIPIR